MLKEKPKALEMIGWLQVHPRSIRGSAVSILDQFIQSARISAGGGWRAALAVSLVGGGGREAEDGEGISTLYRSGTSKQEVIRAL